jgi:hypothetical protein
VVDGLKRNRHDSKRDDIERMEVNYSLHIFELSMEGSERPERRQFGASLACIFHCEYTARETRVGSWGRPVCRYERFAAERNVYVLLGI